jgi:hypothetical protein
VELKPKCGFLPSSACIASRHGIKREVARYQLHQQLKLAQGKISAVSAYDPEDLFSGVPSRMQTALAALFAQPQNNMRLFWRGSAVPDLHSIGRCVLQSYGGMGRLLLLLIKILRREGGELPLVLSCSKEEVHSLGSLSAPRRCAY